MGNLTQNLLIFELPIKLKNWNLEILCNLNQFHQWENSLAYAMLKAEAIRDLVNFAFRELYTFVHF